MQLMNEPFKSQRVLQVCHGQFRAMVLTAIVTGADRGILCNLKKRDVKIFEEDGVLSGEVFLDDRKARGRTRTMTVVTEAAEALLDLIEDKTPGDRVFDEILYSQIDYLWHTARAEAGVDHVRFKDLRHTFAILCDTAGLSPNFIKTGMGHQRLSTTNRYMSRQTSFTAEQARRLHDAMKKTA